MGSQQNAPHHRTARVPSAHFVSLPNILQTAQSATKTLRAVLVRLQKRKAVKDEARGRTGESKARGKKVTAEIAEKWYRNGQF
jgi:hypothetical protein